MKNKLVQFEPYQIVLISEMLDGSENCKGSALSSLHCHVDETW